MTRFDHAGPAVVVVGVAQDIETSSRSGPAGSSTTRSPRHTCSARAGRRASTGLMWPPRAVPPRRRSVDWISNRPSRARSWSRADSGGRSPSRAAGSRSRPTPSSGSRSSPNWSRRRSRTPRGRSELAASRRRIVAAADEARRRIERDLHDGIQQRLDRAHLPRTRDDAETAGRTAGHRGRALGRLEGRVRRAARGLARHPPHDPHRGRARAGTQGARTSVQRPGRRRRTPRRAAAGA